MAFKRSSQLPYKHFYFFFVMAWLLSSCGFYIDKLAQNGSQISFSDQELNQPTFSVIDQKIFQIRCMNCHGVGGVAARIPLSPREELLNSPRELVVPGDSKSSGLIIAVTRADNKRMPPPKAGSALSAVEIEVIKKWIEQGAL